MSVELMVAETLKQYVPVVADNSIYAVTEYFTRRKLIDAEFNVQMERIERDYASTHERREKLATDRQGQLLFLKYMLDAALETGDEDMKQGMLKGIDKYMDNMPDYS